MGNSASFSSSAPGSNRWLIAACLLLVPLPLFLPYLWLDHSYFWGNVDSIFYLNTYTIYRDALWQGDIFPHWDTRMNIGLGSLSLYSLSPLAYSLTALISAPFNGSDEAQFLAGIYASQVVGAWTMWRLLRRHYDDWASISGAILYILIPYKLVVLYQHYNLAQCWAMAFLPLWMEGAERMATRSGRMLYALAAALCLYAHPLTFISMAVLACCYALHLMAWDWKTALKPLLAAHAMALLLSASYLAAMITAMPWMPLQHWGSDFFNSIKNLHHIDDYFGLYAPAIAYIGYRYSKTDSAFMNLKFWCAAIIVLYVVATPLSYPLWAYVPAMNIFQFPFARLQPGIGLAAAIVAAALLASRNREYVMPMLALLILSALVIEFRLQLVYGHHPDNGITPTIQKKARDGLITTSSMPQPVYFPRWSPLSLTALQERSSYFESLPRIQLAEGKGKAKIIQEGRDWIRLHSEVQSPIATFTLAQFYVPAWRGYSESNAVIPGYNADGMVSLALPKGEYDILLQITKTPLEKAGDALTLAMIAYYAAYCGMRRRAQCAR